MIQFLRAAQPGQHQTKRCVLLVTKLFRQFNLLNGKCQRTALNDIVHAAFKKNVGYLFWQRAPERSLISSQHSPQIPWFSMRIPVFFFTCAIQLFSGEKGKPSINESPKQAIVFIHFSPKDFVYSIAFAKIHFVWITNQKFHVKHKIKFCF